MRLLSHGFVFIFPDTLARGREREVDVGRKLCPGSGNSRMLPSRKADLRQVMNVVCRLCSESSCLSGIDQLAAQMTAVYIKDMSGGWEGGEAEFSTKELNFILGGQRDK